MRDKDSVESLTQTLQPLSQHSFDIALDFARGDGGRQSGPGTVMELLARGSPSPRGDSPLSRSESLTSVSGVWDFDVRDEGSGRTWHCKTVMLSRFVVLLTRKASLLQTRSPSTRRRMAR